LTLVAIYFICIHNNYMDVSTYESFG
jgi:hypothetical protein